MILFAGGTTLADHLAISTPPHITLASPNTVVHTVHRTIPLSPPVDPQEAWLVNEMDQDRHQGGPALTDDELLLASGAYHPDKYREYNRQVNDERICPRIWL